MTLRNFIDKTNEAIAKRDDLRARSVRAVFAQQIPDDFWMKDADKLRRIKKILEEKV